MSKHTGPRLRLWVPLYFWSDHADRCPCDNPETDMATEVREAGKRILIVATPKQLEVLRSDAEFYAQGNVDDCASLIRSAKATLAAIAKAVQP